MREELKNNKQKGISIYISLMITFILLSIALGMSVIVISQMQIVHSIKDSIIAFSAANSGTELIMYQDKVCRQPVSCDCTYIPGCSCLAGCKGISTQTTSEITLTNPLGEPLSINGKYLKFQAYFSDGAQKIQSTGKYDGTIRTVEVSRE